MNKNPLLTWAFVGHFTTILQEARSNYQDITQLSSTPIREIKGVALKQNLRNLLPCFIYYLHFYKRITIVIISHLILLFISLVSDLFFWICLTPPGFYQFPSTALFITVAYPFNTWQFVSSQLFIANRSYTTSNSHFCFVRVVFKFTFNFCMHRCLRLSVQRFFDSEYHHGWYFP
jgi:hypothetical protein